MPRSANPVFESQRLAKLTERSRNRLIQTEFLLIGTFCDLAESEARLGHRNRVGELIKKARIAAEAIQHFSRKQLSDAERLEVHRLLDEIEPRLRALAGAA
jgi:hypothetical protein